MPLKIVCIDCQSEDIQLVKSGEEVPLPEADCWACLTPQHGKKVPAEHLRCLTCGAEWFQFALRGTR